MRWGSMTKRSRHATRVVIASCFLAVASAHAATEQVLHRFTGGSDGVEPVADLPEVGGTLYGTTEFGGTGSCQLYTERGCGTVFAFTPEGNAYSVVYSFQGGSDGAYPIARLINVNGTFYGTTSSGGATGNGTVFSLTPQGVETVLYSFSGSPDGANPAGGLIDVDGILYGTTKTGGANSDGTVFSVTVSGAETVLHSFNLSSSDGAFPEADMINVNGTLYGITFGGGSVGSPFCGS